MEYKRLTGKSEGGYNNLSACLNCDLEMDCGLCPYWAKALDRLAELEDKIEQGTLIELPCIVVGTGAIDAFGKVRVPYYQVLWLDKFGMLKMWKSTDKAEAEKRLKEIQG